jgi:hypothetical protein
LAKLIKTGNGILRSLKNSYLSGFLCPERGVILFKTRRKGGKI